MATKQTAPRLTVKQVMAGFKVSDMTIYTWRQGTAAREALPTHQDGNRVFFKEAEMVKWAKKYGLPFDTAAANSLPAVKMGPKATPAPKIDPNTTAAIRDAAAKALGGGKKAAPAKAPAVAKKAAPAKTARKQAVPA